MPAMPKLPITVAALVAVATLGLLALCQCGKVEEDSQVDSGKKAVPSGGTSGTSGTSGASGTSGTSGTSGSASSDAATDATATFDAAPPVVTCTAGSNECDDSPPSVCGDNTTVVFFGAGECVSGTCQWKEKTLSCGVQSYCLNGGCTPPTTK